MRFDYHVEPFRPISAGVAVLVFAAILVALRLALLAVPGTDNPMRFLFEALGRLVLIAAPMGWALWAVLWLLRRGRGITVDENCLLVENRFTGKKTVVPNGDILGVAVSESNGLLVAYQKSSRSQELPVDRSRLALTDARPTSTGPRKVLIVTPPIDHINELTQILSMRINTPSFSPNDLRDWAARLHVRSMILLGLAVLGTPIYVIILGRLVSSAASIGIR